MRPRPVLIDTDTGVDDALALLLALRSPEIEIIGITTVAGNVKVHLCTRNVHEVLRRAGRSGSIPVVAGAPLPLRLPLVTAPEVHGLGGLGTVLGPRAPSVQTDPDAASHFIVEQARIHGRRLTIVAIGPLTNLAQAFLRSPVAMKAVGRIISMGGAFGVPGNTGPLAEFNYYVDPHAARIVIARASRLLIVPLDVTEQTSLMWHEVVRRSRSTSKRWLRKLVRGYMEYHLETEGFRGAYLHDPIAVAEAVRPGVLRSRSSSVAVETSSGTLRGMTSHGKGSGRISVASSMDAETFRSLFQRTWL